MAEPLVAGVELGGTKCNLILASGPDDIREERRVPTTSPAETLSAIEAVLDGWRGFEGLGIASFGPVSVDRRASDWGSITATSKPGWSHTDVGARLMRRFGVPTGFTSDVAGAALGEGRWGAARDVADHAYVTVGTGVGVGLVLGSEPVEGLSHPELGHIRPVRLPEDSWPGHCPFHGDCLEGLASGPAIRARTGHPAEELAADDPAWATVAHALAQLCHTLVLTGIPRRIVMGGGVMVGTPRLFPDIRRRLEASLNDYGATSQIAPVDAFVVPAGLGNRAGPLGAIVLAQRALSAS